VLLEAVSGATELCGRWRQVGVDGGPPRLPADLGGAETAYRQLSDELKSLAGVPRSAIWTP